MPKSILVALTLMLVVGCASSPPPIGLVQPWPTPPPDGYALFFMFRHNNSGGGPDILIDDTKVFEMSGNCYSWIYVRSGGHRFRTKGVRMFGNLNFDTIINFDPGHSYYLTLYQQTDKYVYIKKIKSGIQFVTEQTAKRATTNCWFRKPFVQQVDTPGKQLEGTNTNMSQELKSTVPNVLFIP